MLPLYIVSRYNIRPSNGMLYQWLNISIRLCSSSDSSDSDSDTEKEKQKTFVKSMEPATSDSGTNLQSFLNKMIEDKTLKAVKDTSTISETKMEQESTEKTAVESTDLIEFVNNMLKARKLEKTIDVAIQPKKSNSKRVKFMSYEKKLINAAEDVADKLGEDKVKTTSDLLQKVLEYKARAEKQDEQITEHVDQYKAKTKKKDKKLTKSTNSIKSDVDVMEFIKSRRFAKSDQTPENVQQENSMNVKHSEKKSIIQDLLQEYNKQAETRNVSQQLSKHSKASMQQSENINMRKFYRRDIEIWNGNPSQIFENMGDISPDTPELKTWAALEQKELKALTTYSPANVFQEMILWTEQGKLWKFPIDNEQGMEEEQNVHFSEHVFTERYLKGWCPTSGPIRHFMELVCVGLSKNPYLTVQEKINHIMWYKDYFKSKEQLLQELGAIKESIPDTVKQITHVFCKNFGHNFSRFLRHKTRWLR